MKLSIWIATRELRTWISAAEILALCLILYASPGPLVALLTGGPILGHLGWTALASMPTGQIPGRPSGAESRENYELRLRVVALLNEVKRIEQYVRDAKARGLPRNEVERSLQVAQERVRAKADRIAEAFGQVA